MQPSSPTVFYTYKKPHVVNFLLYCLWILFDLGNIISIALFCFCCTKVKYSNIYNNLGFPFIGISS